MLLLPCCTTMQQCAAAALRTRAVRSTCRHARRIDQRHPWRGGPPVLWLQCQVRHEPEPGACPHSRQRRAPSRAGRRLALWPAAGRVVRSRRSAPSSAHEPHQQRGVAWAPQRGEAVVAACSTAAAPPAPCYARCAEEVPQLGGLVHAHARSQLRCAPGAAGPVPFQLHCAHGAVVFIMSAAAELLVPVHSARPRLPACPIGGGRVASTSRPHTTAPQPPGIQQRGCWLNLPNRTKQTSASRPIEHDRAVCLRVLCRWQKLTSASRPSTTTRSGLTGRPRACSSTCRRVGAPPHALLSLSACRTLAQLLQFQHAMPAPAGPRPEPVLSWLVCSLLASPTPQSSLV